MENISLFEKTVGFHSAGCIIIVWALNQIQYEYYFFSLFPAIIFLLFMHKKA